MDSLSSPIEPARPAKELPVTVVVCVDAGFAPLVLVVAASIAAAASGRRPVTLHVMYCGADAPVLRQLSAFVDGPVTVVVHRLQNPLDHLPSPGRLSPIIYLRLLIPDLLPDCDRVLYLDVDTVLLDDVGELFDVELGGQPLGAVCDLGMWAQRDQPANNPLTGGSISDYLRTMRPGRPASAMDYFNSGVLLMDLAQWRQRGLSQQLVGAIRDYTGHKWPDQDLLNSVFADNVTWLDPRWNVMIEAVLSAGEFLDAPDLIRRALARQLETPGLAHFSNKARPWQQSGPLPFGSLWWDLAEKAGAARYFERPAARPTEPAGAPRWRRAINRMMRASSVLLRG